MLIFIGCSITKLSRGLSYVSKYAIKSGFLVSETSDSMHANDFDLAYFFMQLLWVLGIRGF